MAKITLSTALMVVCDPESFLATYFAIKEGALRSVLWNRRDGGNVLLKRRGCTVRLLAS